VRLSQFYHIFKIDERVRNASFIELCRQSDNLQGFPSHLLLDLMEQKEDPKQLSSHKIKIEEVDPEEPEIKDESNKKSSRAMEAPDNEQILESFNDRALVSQSEDAVFTGSLAKLTVEAS